MRRGRESAERPRVLVQRCAEAGVAGAAIGAAKVAPEVGQLAPGQLVVIRAELLAVKLAAKPDAGEILTVRVVAVKAGGFRLRPYVV